MNIEQLRQDQSHKNRFFFGELFSDSILDFFPLLCRTRPAVAVEIAVEVFKLGHESLMAQGICFREFRLELLNKAGELKQWLDRRENAGQFPPQELVRTSPTELIIFGLVGKSDWIGPLRSKGRKNGQGMAADPDQIAAVAWLTSKKQDIDANTLIRTYLRLEDLDKSLSPTAAHLIVEALRVTRNERFWDDVRVYARNAAAKQEHAEGLVSCLRYFGSFQGRNLQSLRSILQELENYPYRSEVRDLSRSLLGRASAN
jgi:hypothetical protein